jgi:hypothetical protein
MKKPLFGLVWFPLHVQNLLDPSLTPALSPAYALLDKHEAAFCVGIAQ